MTTTVVRYRRADRFAAAPPTEPPEPLLLEWVAQLTTERKALRTVENYSNAVARFAKQVGVSAVSACRADVLAWFTSHPEWALNTAGVNYTALTQWFRWLHRCGHRPDNPMEHIKALPRHRGEPRPITDTELVRLLTLKGIHRRTRMMILLAAYAGLRVSEIARVQGQDLEWSTRLLRVQGKGRQSKDKTVPLCDRLIVAAGAMPARGYWFPSRTDPERPMLGNSVSVVLSDAMRKAGVSGTPHALRHWFASAQLDRGVDLRTVQENMRHENPATTAIYTRIPDQRRHDAVARLDPFGVNLMTEERK